MFGLESLSVVELLQLHSRVLDELKRREVVRTKNNPVEGYAEWLAGERLDLTLEENSKPGYDATDDEGIRYQIKARRVTKSNPSRQLSAFRNLSQKEFDYLIAVIFDHDYSVLQAVRIPHSVIGDYAKYRKHTNAHVLQLRGTIIDDHRVEDITPLLS